MSYCANKTKAIVIYSFSGKKEETFESGSVPIEVEIGTANNAETAPQHFGQNYPGSEPGSYSFTVNAPVSVPRNLPSPPDIYLIGGVWDDYGSIGSYSTGAGTVKRYSGAALKIGSGYSVTGSVTNTLEFECYTSLDLEWRWGGCKITISSQGKQLHEAQGTCPVKFKVSCDDDCPPGDIKCEHPGYPGYCCIPCKGTAQKINNLANKIR